MTENTVYYAIGDVHGMADKLRLLHQQIFTDIDQQLVTRATIVHLGDYIDRGPDSRGVIEQLIQLEAATRADPRFTTVSLRGNHEQMMLNAMDRGHARARDLWSDNGGEATLRSYRGQGRSRDGGVDPSHLQWVSTLPTMHFDDRRKIAFVHAGIDPATFPDCDMEIRMWTRSAKFFDPAQWPDRDQVAELVVVHGHTPTETGAPDIDDHRINVDTGAVFGGPLTCAVLAPHKAPRFLQV